LVETLSTDQFPAFCGALIGLYAFLRYPLWILSKYLEKLLKSRRWRVHPNFSTTTSRFAAAFWSAWLSLRLLNGTHQRKHPQHSVQQTNHLEGFINIKGLRINEGRHGDYVSLSEAGRSLDLTIFAVTRSIETVIGHLWACRKTSRLASGKWTSAEATISHLADAGVFAASSGVIMWAWFYHPDRLPRAYNRWIRGAAQVDPRLVETLRRARRGEFVYDRETGQAALLESFCKDLNLPVAWGNPCLTIPIPCEVVHSGIGPSCHWHSAVRFARAFKFAFATYLPLQLLVKAKKPSWRTFMQALKEAFRSSTFLGAFVGLFYYGVCLARTLLGPKLLQSRGVTPLMWDQGLCIRAGCILCGSSILIEAAKRRQEMAFFVAPKAVATFLPRRYDIKASFRPMIYSITKAYP
jgi:hypothetical protein